MKLCDNVISRNILNSTISVKYFTVAWSGSEKRIWVFLHNFNTQDHFKKKKILDRVYLRNTENVKFRWNSHFTVEYANLDVFIQCQYTKTILRNKNIGQSLLKKHSKFQKFDEILYCGMTRFRNVKLDVFRQYQNTKTILKKKKMWAESF